MANHSKAKDQALLAALGCGATPQNAANKVGVSRRTVFRRLADPAFQEKLRNFRADVIKRTTAMLTASNLEAVKSLMELLNPALPPSVRLGAARTLLELAIRYRENAELDERLRALEDRFDSD